MKMNLITRSAVLALVFCAAIKTSTAQGPLAPTGAPAPVMKSMNQIEPRTPISSVPFIITSSGSYYVTTNLTGSGNGITINADNVTLDLMGFVLQGGTGSGIVGQPGRQNLVVRNGQIRGWSWHGLDFEGITNGVIENVQSTDNSADGFCLGSDIAIRGCFAGGNADDGFSGIHENRFERCRSIDNAFGFYMYGAGNRLEACEAVASGNFGFSCFDEDIIRNCLSAHNGSFGIMARNQCLLQNNIATSNTTFGLYLVGNNSMVEENIVCGNDVYGIYAQDGGNIIVRNTASGNAENHHYAEGNQIGTIRTNVVGAGAWDNFSF